MATAMQQLAEMREKRGPAWARRKKRLLRKIAPTPLNSAQVLRVYHELLMFLVAFPDDAELHRLAKSELERLAETIRLARSSRRGLVNSLRDTGIAHTDLSYVYTLPIVQWLLRVFPDDVELDWDDDSVATALDELGHVFLPHIEQDSMLTDRLSTRELFELARGAETNTVLSWIVGRYEQLGKTASNRIEFFDLMDIRLRWRLNGKMASRTFIRFPKRRLSLSENRTDGTKEFTRQLAARLPKDKPLSAQAANHLIDVARATLSVRHRETEAVTYPNPDEISLFQLDGGIDVAIYGMTPQHRLAIESFFGFVAAKNGVPVAYGGGFVYLHRLDIGLNIFHEFRRGESAFLFTQILRAFSQHYSSTQIIIDSAQFGYGRVGGIRSGAFWFYYKLGFRPVDKKLALLAETEWVRIKAEPGYRTPATKLRKFTESDLAFNLDDNDDRLQPLPAMADISLAVTRHAAKHHNGDREAQAQWAQRRVRRLLKAGDTKQWPDAERQAFLRMCPLVALIADLPAWTERQKRALVALMRAKGGRKERRFVLLLQRHRKLAGALAELARSSH